MKIETKMDDKQVFKKEIKRNFSEMLIETTSHGVQRLMKKKEEKSWFLFIMWGLLYTASLSYCSYTVLTSVILFFNYKIKTSVTLVQEIPSVYPGLTICNLNPFFESTIKHVIDLPTIFNCFDTKNGIEFAKCMGVNDTRSGFDSLYQKIHRYVANNKTLRAIDLINLGYQLRNDMLVSCNYNGKPCTACDFKYFWDYR